MAFPFRDATPVPVSVEPSPVDVGSVAAVGDMRITGGGRRSSAGRHGGRRLASVRAEIHFNITSQREVP